MNEQIFNLTYCIHVHVTDEINKKKKTLLLGVFICQNYEMCTCMSNGFLLIIQDVCKGLCNSLNISLVFSCLLYGNKLLKRKCNFFHNNNLCVTYSYIWATLGINVLYKGALKQSCSMDNVQLLFLLVNVAKVKPSNLHSLGKTTFCLAYSSHFVGGLGFGICNVKEKNNNITWSIL